jgi:hypothetical protein
MHCRPSWLPLVSLTGKTLVSGRVRQLRSKRRGGRRLAATLTTPTIFLRVGLWCRAMNHIPLVSPHASARGGSSPIHDSFLSAYPLSSNVLRLMTTISLPNATGRAAWRLFLNASTFALRSSFFTASMIRTMQLYSNVYSSGFIHVYCV